VVSPDQTPTPSFSLARFGHSPTLRFFRWTEVSRSGWLFQEGESRAFPFFEAASPSFVPTTDPPEPAPTLRKELLSLAAEA
jgi:hypothetical protein